MIFISYLPMDLKKLHEGDLLEEFSVSTMDLKDVNANIVCCLCCTFWKKTGAVLNEGLDNCHDLD